MWYARPAQGLDAVAKIISGAINPSGRLMDTYVNDNFSAPAMQVKVTNTGDTAGKDVAQVYFTAPYTVGGIENLFMELSGTGADGNDWLKSRAILLNDGTWTLEFDYDAENSRIQTDSGTWTENEDDSLSLTGTRDFTAAAADNGDGTVSYTMEVLNAETNITCEISGTAAVG